MTYDPWVMSSLPLPLEEDKLISDAAQPFLCTPKRKLPFRTCIHQQMVRASHSACGKHWVSLVSQLSQQHVDKNNQEITFKGNWPLERRNKIQTEEVIHKEINVTEEIDKFHFIIP